MRTGNEMGQNARDLAKAGGYIFGVGFLLASVAFAGASALRELPNAPVFNWVAELIEPASTQETRLSQALINSREIKAALAKPIPRPEPLPPITAKLTYGHLRPGGSGATAQNFERLKLPKAALEANAMVDQPNHLRANSAIITDLHRVY